MSWVEIILLAFGLCADTLAVTMAFGAAKGRIPFKNHLRIDLSFGLIHVLFLGLGWMLGEAFLEVISAFDHWVAFGLLLLIGVKMIADSFKADAHEASVDLLKPAQLALAGVATSIDALAVGISLAIVQMPAQRILATIGILFAVTASVAAAGLAGGGAFKKVLGSKAGIFAGIILIAIGIKILLEHLVF